MSYFRGNSVRQTTILLFLLTSITALGLTTLGFAVSDWLAAKSALRDRLESQAAIIRDNSRAALIFDDSEAATQTLISLKNDTNIVAAAIYDQNDILFASYGQDNYELPLNANIDSSQQTLNTHPSVSVPVIVEGEIIGHVLLVADFKQWVSQQVHRLSTVLGIFTLSVFGAALLSHWSQTIISRPILRLAATTRRITRSENYNLRAEKLSDDEIGHLVDDFNEMLNQVQLRDQKLKQNQDELEEKVAQRTVELTKITQELKDLAYFDPLTLLANRTNFDQQLQQAVLRANSGKGSFALLFIDLDRFKFINDSLGHSIGDKILVGIASRLRKCLDKEHLIARLGGDEFGIILPNISRRSDVSELADKLIAATNQPFDVNQYTLHLSISIGISICPDDGRSVQEMLKNADTAMYKSKERGRNIATYFDTNMRYQAERRLDIENKLREAFVQNQLSLHYQPRIDLNTKDVIGVEALIRWNDSTEGWISPSEFIPIADECGFISVIDEWVIERACHEMMTCFGGEPPALLMSVNLSTAHFIRKDLTDIIARILAKTGYPGNRLELEITENLFGPDTVDVHELLTEVTKLGVEISIDDFGKAYSSLSRLKHLPLHTLKIDQNFIADIGKDSDDETLVRTIINMAKNLKLKVVAEGVETSEQYEFIKRFGCDSAQGFLFCEPLPIDEFKHMLETSKEIT